MREASTKLILSDIQSNTGSHLVFFRRHKVLAIVLLLITICVAYYLIAFLVGAPFRNHITTTESIGRSFRASVRMENIEPLNSHIYYYQGSVWEILQYPIPGQSWDSVFKVNFISTDGKRYENIITTTDHMIYEERENMYFAKPYLFLVSFPGILHIYNTETKRLKTFDARTSNCQDARTYLTGVAYAKGILYTKQYKDFSFLCYGDFMRRLSLNF